MKRYIKANMLGPAFNIPQGDFAYCIDGCVYNYEDELFEVVDDLHSCCDDVECAADVVLYYLQDDAVEAVIVNGTIEFDSSDFWTKAEVLSKILDEA